jgi:hypothetical protein
MSNLILLMYLFFCNSLNANIIYAMPVTYPAIPIFASTTPMTEPIFPTFTINPPTPPLDDNSKSSNNVYIIGGSLAGCVVFLLLFL